MAASIQQATIGSSTTLDQPEDDIEMSFLDHLGELRRRLIYSVIGTVPCIAIAWIFRERIMDFMIRPLAKAWKMRGLGEPVLHFANPMDGLVAYMQVAIVAGLLLSAPWIFWQLWTFVAPGLYRKERRLALPFALASTVFFAGGAIFGYAVVFPPIFETLLSFSGMLPSHAARIQPTIMVDDYLTFSTRMLLAFGVTFEVPVIVTFLAASGIVDWKQLLRFGRYWVVIASVIAAVLTPPDVGSQLLMMGPLIGLYFLSVGLAFLFRHKKTTKFRDARA